eukprot:2850846-Pyramimonas_sp.AAC.1
MRFWWIAVSTCDAYTRFVELKKCQASSGASLGLLLQPAFQLLLFHILCVPPGPPSAAIPFSLPPDPATSPLLLPACPERVARPLR